MSCEKFERRLHQLLDERRPLADDAPLRRHAQACPRCETLLAAYGALEEGLAECEAPQPSPGFVERVLKQANCGLQHVEEGAGHHAPAAGATLGRRTAIGAIERPNARTARRLAASWNPWTVAAILLFAAAPLSLWLARFGGESTTGSRPLAHVPAGEAAPSQHAEASPQFPTALEVANDPQDDGGEALDASSEGGNREDHYAVMLERWRMRLPELGDTLGLTDGAAPTVRSAAAVSQLTNRLRSPLSASIESTLNVLRTALPNGAEQNPTKPQAGRHDSHHAGLT